MTDDTTDRLETLKKRVDDLKTEKIRAQERLDNALDQLRTIYGYETVSEAQTAYDRATKEIPILRAKLDTLLAQAETTLDKIEIVN
jgi:chromosome segregation ATPase